MSSFQSFSQMLFPPAVYMYTQIDSISFFFLFFLLNREKIVMYPHQQEKVIGKDAELASYKEAN